MTNIAVLAAMGMEADRLIRRMEGAQTETIAGQKFLRGRIGGAQVALHVCGMGMRKADKGARALIEKYRPDALVLYGVSGGLVPDIELNETVIAAACSRGGVHVATDEGLADFAARVLPEARKALLSTTRTVTVLKRSKTRIARGNGAVCVDMESFAAAKTARELGVPLLVIRSISDTFEPASLLAFFKNGAIAAEKAAADTEAVIKALAEVRP